MPGSPSGWSGGPDEAGEEPAARGHPTERRLERLAAAVGPLRGVLAALAGRLVATRGYERLCYARLSDYARERLGLSARQLQELARVDRALAGLPALGRALLGNELPWSKVRLIARVATPEDECAWIERARDVSTQVIERLVRKTDPSTGSQEAAEATLGARIRVRCTPAVVEKWHVAREMAERVAGQRLAAGEVLELVAAEVFSAVSMDPTYADDAGAPRNPPPPESTRAREEALESAKRAAPPELPQAAAWLAAGLDDADAFELDRRLRLAVQLEQTLDAAMAPLLRVVISAEYEWRGRYQTLSTYAQNTLGISASKARALLRLERAGDVCPELREAYRHGKLSWVKAQCLLPLLLLDMDGAWRPAWVAWAGRVTLRRLAADVERALLLRAGHHRAWQRCKFHPARVQDPIPAGERQMCAPDVDPEATQRLAWRVPVDVASLFSAVHGTLRAKLASRGGRWPTEGEAFDALLDLALLAWNLRDPRTRRPDPVMERDGYRCAVPGCTSRCSLHDHHIVFRSACGSDAPDNRLSLCAFHHQRCLHAGLLRIRGAAPDALVFELGLRPGCPPLARYRSGDIALPGSPKAWNC